MQNGLTTRVVPANLGMVSRAPNAGQNKPDAATASAVRVITNCNHMVT